MVNSHMCLSLKIPKRCTNGHRSLNPCAAHTNELLFVFCSRRKKVGSTNKSRMSGVLRCHYQAVTHCLFLAYQQ